MTSVFQHVKDYNKNLSGKNGKKIHPVIYRIDVVF